MVNDLMRLTDINNEEIYINTAAITSIVKSQVLMNSNGPEPEKVPCVVINLGSMNSVRVPVSEWDRIRQGMVGREEKLEK